MRAVGYLVGSGSMSLGIEAAGFELERPWETRGYSRNARNWDINRPERAHMVMDLSSFARFPGADETTDLVYGNPPCGGLSGVTGAKASSPTNRHMVDWLRMVLASRPRAILMENASNLASRSGASIRDELGALLDVSGYSHCVWQFWSWQIGTPQKRRRCFLVAVRDGKLPASFIQLSDLPKEPPVDSWLRPHLVDLENVEPSPDPVQCGSGTTTLHWWDSFGIETQDLLVKHWPNFERSHYTRLRYDSGEGAKAVDWLPVNWQNAWITRVPMLIGDGNSPAPAIFSGYCYIHYSKRRLLTMREHARLMGYPDSWRFKDLRPGWVAQGVPKWNAEWAARRIATQLV